jgi:hypothetical protein
MCFGWSAMTAAASANETGAARSDPTSTETLPRSTVVDDPCADFDLTSIQGLRGTIISRVHPAQFSQGDQVTVCGRGLSMARFVENYQPEAGGVLQAGNFVEIGDETSKRGWRLQVFGLSVTPNGDRVRFVVGGLFENFIQRSSSSSTYFLVPAGRPGLRPAQNTAQGELRIVLSGSQFGPPKVTGPVVTWSVGGPKPRHAYGRFFSKQEPFVITPQGRDQVISPELGLITIEGGNLGSANYRIGETPLKTFGMPGGDGTSVVAAVPQNAAAGAICAFGSGERNCVGVLAVQPGPTVTRTPQMPLQLHTQYTIEGTNLKPTVPGLSYRIVMSGLTGDAACAQVLKVSEHTARKIQFSLGDVDDNSPTPETCSRASNYQTPQENPSNLIFLMARYKNQERPLYQLHYYIGQQNRD